MSLPIASFMDMGGMDHGAPSANASAAAAGGGMSMGGGACKSESGVCHLRHSCRESTTLRYALMLSACLHWHSS